jgi:hypothetical protein
MGVTNDGLNAIASLIADDGNWNGFSAANSYLAVGDGQTAFSSSQHTLQASGSNKLWKQCDSVTVTANSMVFVATFAAADAVFTWYENGVFNASGAASFNGSAPNCMLTRAQENLITKTSNESVVLTKTIVIASA